MTLRRTISHASTPAQVVTETTGAPPMEGAHKRGSRIGSPAGVSLVSMLPVIRPGARHRRGRAPAQGVHSDADPVCAGLLRRNSSRPTRSTGSTRLDHPFIQRLTQTESEGFCPNHGSGRCFAGPIGEEGLVVIRAASRWSRGYSMSKGRQESGREETSDTLAEILVFHSKTNPRRSNWKRPGN